MGLSLGSTSARRSWASLNGSEPRDRSMIYRRDLYGSTNSIVRVAVLTYNAQVKRGIRRSIESDCHVGRLPLHCVHVARQILLPLL